MSNLALEIACCHLCAVSDIKEVGYAKEIHVEGIKEEEKVDVTEIMRKAMRICLMAGLDAATYRDAVREARSLPLLERNKIATESKHFSALVPNRVIVKLVMEA